MQKGRSDMVDRENVINGLECIAQQVGDGICGWCAYFRPFRDDPDCGWCDKVAIVNDALALLREQDQSNKPREERHEVTINHVWGDDVEVWSEFYCPHCGAMIAKGNSEHYPRCMWCGKKIQWV